MRKMCVQLKSGRWESKGAEEATMNRDQKIKKAIAIVEGKSAK